MMKMQIKPAMAAGIGLAVMALAGGWPGFAAAADSGAWQTITIDPDTGAVIAAPGITRQRTTIQQQRSKARKTPDGAQRLASGSGQATSAPVIHCPDGSLRMGRARTTHGESPRAALCAQAIR
jgi:hypothetical protein